jgi:hypothetical protein
MHHDCQISTWQNLVLNLQLPVLGKAEDASKVLLGDPIQLARLNLLLDVLKVLSSEMDQAEIRKIR